jgi:hypothetical protein
MAGLCRWQLNPSGAAFQNDTAIPLLLLCPRMARCGQTLDLNSFLCTRTCDRLPPRPKEMCTHNTAKQTVSLPVFIRPHCYRIRSLSRPVDSPSSEYRSSTRTVRRLQTLRSSATWCRVRHRAALKTSPQTRHLYLSILETSTTFLHEPWTSQILVVYGFEQLASRSGWLNASGRAQNTHWTGSCGGLGPIRAWSKSWWGPELARTWAKSWWGPQPVWTWAKSWWGQEPVRTWAKSWWAQSQYGHGQKVGGAQSQYGHGQKAGEA